MDVMQAVVTELQKVHRLSERDAASIAMTVSGVVDMTLKAFTAPGASRCPFRDPLFRMKVDEPCPVCGMLGDMNAKNVCVDP